MAPERRAPARRPGTTSGDLSRIGVRGGGADAPGWRGGRGAPYLAPILLALLAGAALWFGRGRLLSCGAALESPEAQVRRALTGQARAQLDDVYGFKGGGTVDLHALRFDDVAASFEGDRATVVAMLTAQGRVTWRAERAELTYLGRERFHMTPCPLTRWCGEGDQFARLRGVLLALFRHHDARLRGDAEGALRLASPAWSDRGEDRTALAARLAREVRAAPGARVRAWQIRVERDGAEVGEDLEVPATGGGSAPERHVYRLVPADGRWLFAAGL